MLGRSYAAAAAAAEGGCPPNILWPQGRGSFGPETRLYPSPPRKLNIEVLGVAKVLATTVAIRTLQPPCAAAVAASVRARDPSDGIERADGFLVYFEQSRYRAEIAGAIAVDQRRSRCVDEIVRAGALEVRPGAAPATRPGAAPVNVDRVQGRRSALFV